MAKDDDTKKPKWVRCSNFMSDGSTPCNIGMLDACKIFWVMSYFACKEKIVPVQKYRKNAAHKQKFQNFNFKRTLTGKADELENWCHSDYLHAALKRKSTAFCLPCHENLRTSLLQFVRLSQLLLSTFIMVALMA